MEINWYIYYVNQSNLNHLNQPNMKTPIIRPSKLKTLIAIIEQRINIQKNHQSPSVDWDSGVNEINGAVTKLVEVNKKIGNLIQRENMLMNIVISKTDDFKFN